LGIDSRRFEYNGRLTSYWTRLFHQEQLLEEQQKGSTGGYMREPIGSCDLWWQDTGAQSFMTELLRSSIATSSWKRKFLFLELRPGGLETLWHR
jgi:hypothetical protein